MKKVFIYKIIIWFLGIIITASAVGFLGFIYLSRNLPTTEEIYAQDIIESTKIFDRTGEILLYEIRGEARRTNLRSEDIPQVLKQATVAVEDSNFFKHPAFDFRGILRALWVGVQRGRITQGGSTITQQLARNLFLTPERTVFRKIKELILAFRLEQVYTKDEILTLYLNRIPYGHNAYGVEAAAQMFFGKSAIELNLSEAAMLAALPQAPSYFSPWGLHTTELEQRRRHVLSRMKLLGMIDEQQHQFAVANKPVVRERPKTSSFAIAPHFIMEVQQYLNNKYGEDFVTRAGLNVITTLDVELQKIANTVALRGGDRNTELFSGHNAALIAMDPRNGQVLALVGSKDYFRKPEPEGCIEGSTCRFEGNFNVVTQGLRQPGSAFKPFVYMAAFMRGLTPNTILFDVPTEFAAGNPNCPPIPDFNRSSPGCYHPQNFNNLFQGPMTLKESLAESTNVTAVKTLYLAGLNYTIELAERLGFTTLTDGARLGLSLVLGGGEVRMIEMAEAYSVLANDGIRNPHTFIIQIKDNEGKILESHEASPERIVEANYARLINDILADKNLRAPLFGGSLRLTGVPGYQIAMKTGTSDDFIDVWAFGYTPNLVAGVWAGNNNRFPLQRRGGSVFAATPMWHDFISQAVKLRANEVFPASEPIETTIPILRGELNRENPRNILFYLNRLDDPQFPNWEAGVQNWLRTNVLPEILIPTRPSLTREEGERVVNVGPIINVLNIRNGDFITNDLSLRAEIRSNTGIQKIEVYINDRLADSVLGNAQKQINYYKTFSINEFTSQNKLVIEAVNIAGNTSRAELILYR